jgi:DNA-binding NtrC family response regulator
MVQGSVLVVDDRTYFTTAVQRHLEALDLESAVAADPGKALGLLKDNRFHALFCNPLVKNADEFLRQAQRRGLHIPLIILTNDPKWNAADNSLTLAVFECLSKPVTPASLTAVLRRALLRSGLLLRTMATPQRTPLVRSFPFLIGTSQQMRDLLVQIAKIAGSNSTVCVSGESGTGKELVARAIHYSSHRADRPFIVFDCAATTEISLESDLFGHVKGALSTATNDREGAFQLADSGTLFIDEVGDLPLALQARLVRVIQTREIRRVGGKDPIPVDVRIIAASRGDLKKMVREKRFREDLLQRLDVVPLAIPPLRQRKEDIPLLVDHFFQKFNRNSPKQMDGVTSRTMAALLRHQWPGNVRELENCLERAAAMASGKMIDLEDIGFLLGMPARLAGPAPDPGPCSLKEYQHLAERELILKTLQDAKGNRTRTAQLLRISLRTLHYKLREIQKLEHLAPPQA